MRVVVWVVISVTLGSVPAASAAEAAVHPARCVPGSADRVLASSARTAVYRLGRRVIACSEGRGSRRLATLTLGRRVDAAAVRGTRVAVAGALSSEDAFEGFSRFDVAKVVDLGGGAPLESQTFGRVSTLRLTATGAIGVERRHPGVALFAVNAQGRVLLDRRTTITGLRVHGDRIGWTAGRVRRRYDATAMTSLLRIAGPVPDHGTARVPGTFVAPRPGRYTVGGPPVPDSGRSESCPGGASGVLRATTAGQTIAFALAPYFEEWCHKGLDVTLSAVFGPDTHDAPATCVGRSVPCGGQLRLAKVQLPAS